MNDGSLLGCFTAISGANKLISVVRSTNDGSSWNPLGTVISVINADYALDNCALHQLPNSRRILASFRNHFRDNTLDPPQYTKFVISVRSSDDGGKTWQALSTVATSSIRNHGIWEPFIVDSLDKKSLMLFYSRETMDNASDQNNLIIWSYNQGKTWVDEEIISGKATDKYMRDGMVGVARVSPGSRKLMAVFESLAPETGITSVTSADDGLTWINRKPVYFNPTRGVRHQAPQIVLVGTMLVTTFQTNENTLGDIRGNVPWTKIIVSTDAGRTWGPKTLIHKDCEWTGATTIDSKKLLVFCNEYGPVRNDTSQKISYSHLVTL
jgi:hypothetical protein